MSIEAAIGRIWSDTAVVDLFHELCDQGGRLAGTESELSARHVLSAHLDGLSGKRADFSFQYTGRHPGPATVTLTGTGRQLQPVTLPGSPPAQLTGLGLVDVGVGVQEEFSARGGDITGNAVIVAHEYPFTLGHVHRSRKYASACEAGASAFIIANNIPSVGPVTGGSGGHGEHDIPAIGVSFEDGRLLRAHAAGGGRIDLDVASTQNTWDATNLILDLPGREDRYVVLCAHVDGHNLAESAMDNATGLAATLEVARVLGPLVKDLRFGLRIALFTTEEWGLDGSKRYVASLSQAEREQIVAAIALDSITGHPRLSALTGGYREMADLVGRYAGNTGAVIDVVTPRLPNSDHVNFQDAGIPAMRLIAGYGYRDSQTRFLLTPADRREIVDITQLKAATSVVAGLVHAACSGT